MCATRVDLSKFQSFEISRFQVICRATDFKALKLCNFRSGIKNGLISSNESGDSLWICVSTTLMSYSSRDTIFSVASHPCLFATPFFLTLVIFLAFPRQIQPGFGICCQHIITTSNQKVTKNGTLVQNPEFPARLENTNIPFMYMVSNIADDVCSIRIDFIRQELRQDLEPARVLPDIFEDDCIDKLEFV